MARVATPKKKKISVAAELGRLKNELRDVSVKAMVYEGQTGLAPPCLYHSLIHCIVLV
jgi:hypothetical protein